MKSNKLSLAAVIVVLLLVIPTTAQDKKVCPMGELNVSFDLPSEAGMASFQRVTVDENCNIIREPVKTIRFNELPPKIRNLVTDERAEMSNRRETLRSAGEHTFWMVHQLFDVVNIELNSLRSTVRTTWDSYNIITDFWYFAAYDEHHESGTCGPGWYLLSTKNLIKSGGVGQKYATSKQQGKWGYKGLFDCSGGAYLNKLKNLSTVSTFTGSAVVNCDFVFTPKNGYWFPGWYTVSYCIS